MAAYEAAGFTPPAPVAHVTVRGENGESVDAVPLLIDSGADVTLLPRAAVARLALTVVPGRVYELQHFDGQTTHASVVRADLVFCRRTFRGQFLVLDAPVGILGRNVLNAVGLVLDGPRLLWRETGGPGSSE